MEIFEEGKIVVFNNQTDVQKVIDHNETYESARKFTFDIKPDFGALFFEKVKYVYIRESIKGTFDLRPFPNIEYLQVSDWNKNFSLKGIGGLKRLIWVYLNSYRPKEKDLTPFKECDALQEIRIDRTTITSIHGIERMPALRRLLADNAKNMSDIGPLIQRGRLLKAEPFWFLLSHSKNVDWTGLMKLDEECPHIKDLGLLNLNDIPSLNFVRFLTGLRSLNIRGTNVVDGNMNAGTGLFRFWHDNKRHYNLKCAHAELGWGPDHKHEMILPKL